MDRSSSRVFRRAPLVVGVTAVAIAAVAAGPVGAAAKTLYVSPQGKNNAACSQTAPCARIGHAVAIAGKGATVMVAAGTYREEVRIAKPVSVIGVGKPVIDAKGRANGFLLSGAGAAGALVQGFVVKDAIFEGIIAVRTSNVTIRNNVVQQNDQGAQAKPQVGECAPQGEVPGDCGEGLHLMTVTNSQVVGNTVTNNAGGILLTDEFGPTAGNVIAGNQANDNVFDCGITIAGHSPNAVSASGVPQPTAAGIYGNTITGNVTDGNGVKGEGAGILLAAGGPGSAVYGNLVMGNSAKGNELAGVTLHSHAPGQHLNGNLIVGNVIGMNGIGSPVVPAGDPDAGATQTVGILIFSAVGALTDTVIAGNQISDVYYGIWTQNTPPVDAGANSFSNVQVPVFAK
jgi:parallel beta-helix repeat protein